MLFEVLQNVANELPDCQLTSVVSLDSGLALASLSPGAADAAAADAFHSQLYKLVAQALREVGSGAPVDDVVVHGERNTFVSVPLGETGYFWHVVTASSTTLGFTQAVMRKYCDEIAAGTRSLVGE